MRISWQLAAFLMLLTAAIQPRATAAQQGARPSPAKPQQTAQSGKTAEPDARADAYYYFTLGHYYQQEYGTSNHAEDANRAIDFYKKAYALDPDSQQISEELAEIYFQSQRIRDAVLEAQAVIAKDPDNLPARRLLARIYVRTLGDMSDTSGQRDTLARAAEQYREITRLDPADTDAALWLARLYRLQNEHDKSEGILRGLLAREPENENAVEQLSQLLLDEGKSQEAIATLKGILDRAPVPRLWDLYGDAYTQIHDLANAEQAYRKASEAQPGGINHRRGLAQTLLNEEKFPEAIEQYKRLSEMDPEDPDNYVRLAEIYRQLKQLDKAEQNVLLAKQRAPGNLEVIYYESSIYQAQGRFEDAIRVLSDAVTGVKAQSEFTPSRRRTLAILFQQLGQLYREVSNYGAAVNTFEEMLRLGPEEDRRARAMIIDTYRVARDIPKALEASRKAMEAYPKDRTIRTTQALLLGQNAWAKTRRPTRRSRNFGSCSTELQPISKFSSISLKSRSKGTTGPKPNRPFMPRKRLPRNPPTRKRPVSCLARYLNARRNSTRPRSSSAKCSTQILAILRYSTIMGTCWPIGAFAWTKPRN